jgi:type II secretory pathway pseudopilin PulG
MRRLRDQGGITLMELLVSMVILTVISTMLLVSWFALSNSYSFSVNSNKARDLARQGLSRMEREVRDAESYTPGLPPANLAPWPAFSNKTVQNEPALIYARPYTIVLMTTFNESGNASPSKKSHLVMYRVYYDAASNTAELWRFEDVPDAAGNYQGRINGVALSAGAEPMVNGRPNYDVNEKTSGEGAQLMLSHVVNTDSSFATPVPVFEYGAYYTAGSGTMEWRDDLGGAATASTNRGSVIAVQIHLLVDLNPRHSPVYIDLVTTAQLRNQRRY